MEAHSGRIHECPIETCKKQYNTRHAFRNHLKIHQKKGIMVEIPEFRYENEEEEDDKEHSSSKAEATPNSDNGLAGLPDLKPEANLVERFSESDNDVSFNNVNRNALFENSSETVNSIDQPPSLQVINPQFSI